jgi:hypothetical protein
MENLGHFRMEIYSVAFDRIQSFSRRTEAAFAFANALKQPAEFN